MKRRLLACLLATILLCLPMLSAMAETVYSEGYFYYTVTDGSITITGYFGSETEVTIPASIAGIPVNAIGPGAFVGTGVQVLYLPDTILYIAEGATGTARVVFPENAPSASQTEQPTETESPSSAANATPKPNGGTTEAPAAIAMNETEPDEHESIEFEDVDDAPSTPFDVTIREGNGVVFASADPTAAPEKPSVSETPPQPLPTSRDVDPTPVEPEKPQTFLWVWLAMGGALLLGAAAIVWVLKLRKR